MDLEIAYEESRKNIKSAFLPDLDLPVYDNTINNNKHRFSVKNATRDLGNRSPQTVLASYRGNTQSGGYVKGNFTIRADKCTYIDLPAGSYFFVFESKEDKTITKYRNKDPYDFSSYQKLLAPLLQFTLDTLSGSEPNFELHVCPQ